MDAIRARFDKIHSSRRCARALATARIVGNKTTYDFLVRHAALFEADSGLSHCIRLATLFEDFVIDGGAGKYVAQRAQAYGKLGASAEMIYIWIMLADSYIRANHSGGHDELLGDGCDDGLRIRVSRFGSYFGIDPQMIEACHANRQFIHIAAKGFFKNIPLNPALGKLMQQMYKTIWYCAQSDARLSAREIQAFVKRHTPPIMHTALG